MYDSITLLIEQFVKNRLNYLRDLRMQDFKSLLSVFESYTNGKRILKSDSEDALNLAMKNAVEKFQQIAEKHTFDIWLSLTRRFPPTPLFHCNWVVHTTLGLLRHAQMKLEPIFQQVQLSELESGITLAFINEDLINAFRLAGLGSDIAKLLTLRRGVSKGMSLWLDEDGMPHAKASEEVKKAINLYDMRAP